mgnify:CR=1 FL=1
MKGHIENLEQRIGYSFKDKTLLRQALMHSSYTNEHHLHKENCNERLEFLGDAVLELSSSEYLFKLYPDKPEGELTKLRASLVCEPALALSSRQIGLGEYLLMGKGEELTGGRERPSIVSDAVEALIGAIYLDGGFASAKEFILRYILNDIENKQLFYDSKTILQEMVQSQYEESLSYKLLREEGPDHNKSYEVQVLLGTSVLGKGRGRTKKAAEQEAAYQGILSLRAGERNGVCT